MAQKLQNRPHDSFNRQIFDKKDRAKHTFYHAEKNSYYYIPIFQQNSEIKFGGSTYNIIKLKKRTETALLYRIQKEQPDNRKILIEYVFSFDHNQQNENYEYFRDDTNDGIEFRHQCRIVLKRNQEIQEKSLQLLRFIQLNNQNQEKKIKLLNQLSNEQLQQIEYNQIFVNENHDNLQIEIRKKQQDVSCFIQAPFAVSPTITYQQTFLIGFYHSLLNNTTIFNQYVNKEQNLQQYIKKSQAPLFLQQQITGALKYNYKLQIPKNILIKEINFIIEKQQNEEEQQVVQQVKQLLNELMENIEQQKDIQQISPTCQKYSEEQKQGLQEISVIKSEDQQKRERISQLFNDLQNFFLNKSTQNLISALAKLKCCKRKINKDNQNMSQWENKCGQLKQQITSTSRKQDNGQQNVHEDKELIDELKKKTTQQEISQIISVYNYNTSMALTDDYSTLPSELQALIDDQEIIFLESEEKIKTLLEFYQEFLQNSNQFIPYFDSTILLSFYQEIQKKFKAPIKKAYQNINVNVDAVSIEYRAKYIRRLGLSIIVSLKNHHLYDKIPDISGLIENIKYISAEFQSNFLTANNNLFKILQEFEDQLYAEFDAALHLCKPAGKSREKAIEDFFKNRIAKIQHICHISNLNTDNKRVSDYDEKRGDPNKLNLDLLQNISQENDQMIKELINFNEKKTKLPYDINGIIKTDTNKFHSKDSNESLYEIRQHPEEDYQKRRNTSINKGFEKNKTQQNSNY